MKQDEIIEELQAIKNRNKKVEAEKAWEISPYRKFSLLFITYIASVIVMYLLKIEDYGVRAFLATF